MAPSPAIEDSRVLHEALARAEVLEGEGQFLAAAKTLEQVSCDLRPPTLDARIVALRHLAGSEPPGPVPLVDREPPEDLFPGTVGVPEVPAADLDVEVLRSALHHHGSLIVRGLLEPAFCDWMRMAIDRSFEAYDERVGRSPEESAPWYANLDLSPGNVPLDPLGGAFLRSGGGVYGPCAPRAFVEYRLALERAGVTSTIAELLGEPPVLSVNKCVLRRIGGGAHPTWHQDGCYLGTSSRAVNLWMALCRCGGETEVMGMDLLAGRQHRLAEAGTHDAIDERAISQHIVEALSKESGRPIVSPIFEPGDGILFDQFFIHRSDVRELPTERYAVESWFFAPSTRPDHQIPIAAT